MTQNDYQMALLLQQQFEHEANIDCPTSNLVYKKTKGKNNQTSTNSLTDPSWELIDPTPNIHVLFMAFNEKYFWNKLLIVCVDWSKRMTSCAGICSYQGRGGMCRITLSEPLLKLRPRKDLIETLLHEMIHAYLFVTHNNRDRDGHGPEFHKHMHRINAEAGTNITVYHDFHDEVRLYKQHWWRCNGPCQKSKPFFGMVRRATNRAPGPNDRWWAEHQQRCGGTFIKVKEPEKPQKKKIQKENKPVVNPKNDIRSFYPVVNGKNSTSSTNFGSLNNANTNESVNRVTGFKDLNKARPKNALANSSSTIVINKKPATKTKQDTEQSEKPTSNLVQLPSTSTSVTAFSGAGQVMSSKNPKDNKDYAAVRNHWLNKFSNVPTTTKRPSDSKVPVVVKKPKPEPAQNHIETKVEVIDLASDSDNIEKVNCPVCQKSFPVNEVNAHLDQCLQEQASGPSTSKPTNCPVCDQLVDADNFDKHVEVCLSNVFSDSNDAEDFNKSPQELISCLVCNKQIPKDSLNAHLDECMGDNIFNNDDNNSANEEDNGDQNVTDGDQNVTDDDSKKLYNCPICFEQFPFGEMSDHLDKCLNNDNEVYMSDNILN